MVSVTGETGQLSRHLGGIWGLVSGFDVVSVTGEKRYLSQHSGGIDVIFLRRV